MNAYQHGNCDGQKQPRICAEQRGYDKNNIMPFGVAVSAAIRANPRLLLAVLRSLAFIGGITVLGGCSRNPGDGIEAVGTVEIREHDIAPMTAARVVRLLVDEGASVNEGDTVAVLSVSTLSADIEQGRARLATAQAALREAEAGPRAAEVQRAEADLRAAEAEADRAARDLVRIQALTESGALAQQQLDNARTLATTTANRRDALRETLQLLRQGTRPERIAAARAEVETARAALAAAQATRSDLVLVAPTRGLVLGRHAEIGEVVPAGTPVMTVGESAKPWVRVYVSPSDAARLTVGALAVATLDDLPDREFPGRVASVATRAEFTPRVALTESERADLLFAVKVELEDSTGTLKAGLPVTVKVRIADSAGAPWAGRTADERRP